MADKWTQLFRLDRSGTKLRFNNKHNRDLIIDLSRVKFMNIRYDSDDIYYIQTDSIYIDGLTRIQAEMIFQEFQGGISL